jgi:hypothetical protein
MTFASATLQKRPVSNYPQLTVSDCLGSQRPRRCRVTPVRGIMNRARAYLCDALASARCHDACHANIGAPPSAQSSSVFLAYFVARALVASGGIDAAARSVLLSHLQDARKGDSYGYDTLAPIDADDTAFALRAHLLLGSAPSSDEILSALAPFESQLSWKTFCGPTLPQGMWTTDYINDLSVFGFHPEVHLNVALLFQETGHPFRPCPPLPFRNSLPANYHYPSHNYCAWLVCELQHARGQTSAGLESALLARQLPDGRWPAVTDGFTAAQETALALLSLSDAAYAANAGRSGVAFLLAQQRADGSWPGGTLWNFRVPGTGGSVIWKAVDAMSIVATSLGLMALSR